MFSRRFETPPVLKNTKGTPGIVQRALREKLHRLLYAGSTKYCFTRFGYFLGRTFLNTVGSFTFRTHQPLDRDPQRNRLARTALLVERRHQPTAQRKGKRLWQTTLEIRERWRRLLDTNRHLQQQRFNQEWPPVYIVQAQHSNRRCLLLAPRKSNLSSDMRWIFRWIKLRRSVEQQITSLASWSRKLFDRTRAGLRLDCGEISLILIKMRYSIDLMRNRCCEKLKCSGISTSSWAQSCHRK